MANTVQVVRAPARVLVQVSKSGPAGAPGAPGTPADTSTLLTKSNNLSDVPNKAAALSTLGGLSSTAAASTYVPIASQGATIGTTNLTGGALTITVSTPWGMRADGTAYYDPAGATAGEEAVLTATASGPVLTRIGA